MNILSVVVFLILAASARQAGAEPTRVDIRRNRRAMTLNLHLIRVTRNKLRVQKGYPLSRLTEPN